MVTIVSDLDLAGGEWVRPSPSARALADLFHGQCSGQELNRDLVYLCSLRPATQILRGLLTAGPRYLATMRATEAAYGQGGTTLRARLRQLVRSVLATSLGQWSLLRALAAAKAPLD